MKNNKQLWFVMAIIGFVASLSVSIIDLYTGAYYIESIWHQAVSLNTWQIPLPFVEAAPVAVDAILASIIIVICQFIFAREALKTRTNKKYMYWAGAGLMTALDAYTDVHFHSGGLKPTVEQWVTSVLVFVILSDVLFAYTTAYLFGDLFDWIKNTFDIGKENVKNLRGGGGNDHRPTKAPTENRHNQRQQRPSFAAQNDVSVSLQPREQKSRQVPVRQNGKQVGNARLREILANSE